MPTYEYVCEKCGHEFELFQSMNDSPIKVCPEDLCARKQWGKGKVRRLLGRGGGLIFKGSGFYITDYRSKNYREAAKKDTAPSAASGGEGKAAPAKSESKADSKSSSKPAAPSKPAK